MAKQKNFNSLATGVIARAEQPIEEGTTEQAPAKWKVTTFEIDPKLEPTLDRLVFWDGPKGSRKILINRALAYYAKHSDFGKENASRPVPGEK